MLSQKQNVSHESTLTKHCFCKRLLLQKLALSPGRARALASLAWECGRMGLDVRCLERNAAPLAPSTLAAFTCLIHVLVNVAYVKTQLTNGCGGVL